MLKKKKKSEKTYYDYHSLGSKNSSSNEEYKIYEEIHTSRKIANFTVV